MPGDLMVRSVRNLAMILIITLSAALSSGAVSAWAGPATRYNPACVMNEDDPYDPGLEFAEGPFAGKCLNTKFSRSVVLLNQLDEGFRVANVIHAGKPWIATINPNDVEEVIFQIEYFPAIVPAAHTQIRFKFKEGREVQLVGQLASASREQTKVRDLVLTVEAVRAIGGAGFDVIKGFGKNFGLAYRIVSMEQRAGEIARDKSVSRVQQMRMALAPAERAAIMKNAILASAANSKMDKFYNTVRRSCTTEAFKVIDRSVRYGFCHGVLVLTNHLILGTVYPVEAVHSLRVRGMLYHRKGSDMPDLKDDADLIATYSKKIPDPVPVVVTEVSSGSGSVPFVPAPAAAVE